MLTGSSKLGAHGPERLVAIVVVEREVLAVRCDADPGVEAGFLCEPGFFDGGVDVVHGDERDAGAPFGCFGAELGEPAVVRVRTGGAQFGRELRRARDATQRRERHLVVLGAVGEEHFGDDAVELELVDATVGLPEAGTAAGADRVGRVVRVDRLRREERPTAEEAPAHLRARREVVGEVVAVARVEVLAVLLDRRPGVAVGGDEDGPIGGEAHSNGSFGYWLTCS